PQGRHGSRRAHLLAAGRAASRKLKPGRDERGAFGAAAAAVSRRGVARRARPLRLARDRAHAGLAARGVFLVARIGAAGAAGAGRLVRAVATAATSGAALGRLRVRLLLLRGVGVSGAAPAQ